MTSPAAPGPHPSVPTQPPSPGPGPGQDPPTPTQILPVTVQALLTEYNSLRQESLQSISNRIQIMNFAFTSLAVVMAAILSTSVTPALVVPICLVFIPVSAKASLLIWLGEYHRSQRAGRGVAAIEARINQHLGEPDLLTWESGLISSRTHMSYPYAATAAYMLSAGILAHVVGIYFLVDIVSGHGTRTAVGAALGAGCYALAQEILFFRFFQRRWRAIRAFSHSQ
ncbi:hypothetical protein AB0J38_28810 [Streptomyces sp. NPDC050095]|uniref:hypothetical protein n=1 Tax=unclassified Streptomyces TaxID=2593676 RepID=UPI00343141FB